MVRIYYLLRTTNRLQSFDSAHDRWADIRNAFEKHFFETQLRESNNSRPAEKQSFAGCVVDNFASFANADNSQIKQWHQRSKLLPSLENGSVILDGDVVILARLPLRATLYMQDVWHRFWLLSLLHRYFARAQTNNDKKIIAIATEFAQFAYQYNLQSLILQLLQTTSELKHIDIACEFTNAFVNPFGESLMPIVSNLLERMCIDMNRRTKFMSKVIHDSGGEIESGDVIARRLYIKDCRLIALVRDVVHAYEPKHCSSVVEETAAAAAAVISTIAEETMTNATNEPENANLTEEDRLKNALQQTQTVTYNTQLYCVTCDVPGHHTSDCPRREFMENLRQLSHASWEAFYAFSGICPHPNSSLVQYASKNFGSRAGVLNRLKRNRNGTVKCVFEKKVDVVNKDFSWIAD